jgi:hypothetical protein
MRPFENLTPHDLQKRGSHNFVYSYRTKQLSSAPDPTSHHELLSLHGVHTGGALGTDVTKPTRQSRYDNGIQIDWNLLNHFVIGVYGPFHGKLCVATFNATDKLEDCFAKLIKKHPELGRDPSSVIVKAGHWSPHPMSEFFRATKSPEVDYLDHNLSFKEWLKGENAN